MNLIKWLGIIGTCVVTSGASVFGMMHFVYSDFETQRTNDVYRDQLEKRLDMIQDDVKSIGSKVDQLSEYLHERK